MDDGKVHILQALGRSKALILPSVYLKDLGWTPGHHLRITRQGDKLIIEQANVDIVPDLV